VASPEKVGVTEALPEAVPTEGVAEPVAAPVREAVTLGEGEKVGRALIEKEPVAEREPVAEKEVRGLPLGLLECVPELEVEGVSEAAPVTEGEAEKVGV
jgi:hypothetical protein